MLYAIGFSMHFKFATGIMPACCWQAVSSRAFCSVRRLQEKAKSGMKARRRYRDADLSLSQADFIDIYYSSLKYTCQIMMISK